MTRYAAVPTGPRIAAGAGELVPLDPDHPGFRDAIYRARRDEIARAALAYRDGDPLPRIPYTEEEHAVWRAVWGKLAPLHARLAASPWKESAAALDLDRTSVPQLADVTETLESGSGFRMIPVAGLISGRGFLGAMAENVFLATQYVRHHSVPLYTPEPDVVHELVGHAAGLFHPDIVRLSRLFGEAARRAGEATMKRLELAYWYTVEFGVVEEKGDLRAWGAGLLSSFGELGDLERHPNLVPLDLEVASRTPYDPTQYQKTLFVSPSWDDMVRDVSDWLGAI